MSTLTLSQQNHHPYSQFDLHHHHQQQTSSYTNINSTFTNQASSSSISMQSSPPLRQRISQVALAARSPPMPPSLLDSPLISSPNSPFRRDHYHNPPAPSHAVEHDTLNIRDTIPLGSQSSGSSRRGSVPQEPEPDDIGAGVSRANSTSGPSSYRTSWTQRPEFGRTNSWLLYQQQLEQSRLSSTSTSSSATPQPQRQSLPINKPYPSPPKPTQQPQQQQSHSSRT